MNVKKNYGTKSLESRGLGEGHLHLKMEARVWVPSAALWEEGIPMSVLH